MKKLLYIAICVIFVSALLLASTAFAQETNGSDIHFIDPIAIAVDGDCLYVADFVDDNTSIILCFELSTTPIYKYSYEIEGRITNIATHDGKLYIILSDCIREYQLSLESQPELVKTYNESGIKDITIGNYRGTDTMYALSEEYLLYYHDEHFVSAVYNLSDTRNCFAVGNYVYFISDGSCKNYDGLVGEYVLNSNSFNKKLSLVEGFTPNGLFDYTDNNSIVAIYDKSIVYSIIKNDGTENYTAQKTLLKVADNDGQIVDIATYGQYLYLLNSNKQVDCYVKNDTGYEKTSIHIGTDIVASACPTLSQVSSFTLAKATGYPTNIIYKTQDNATSIQTLQTNYQDTFIILGYNNENPDYYYVLVGDKFGWVKRSDNSTDTTNDSKIEIVSTEFSTSQVSYKAKFLSLNGVYVYQLPVSGCAYTTFTQTATNMQEATLLQKFTEKSTGIIWYYVEYGQSQRGFVKSTDVGTIHSQGNVSLSAVEDYKINSIFVAVTLYATRDMDKNVVVSDENGNGIKLYSGDRITKIDEEGEASFIMIVDKDGNKMYGWVPTVKLMGIHEISDNAILGIVVLAFALSLFIVLFLSFAKRRKNKNKI